MEISDNETRIHWLTNSSTLNQGASATQNNSNNYEDFANDSNIQNSHTVVPEPPLYILVLSTISFVLIFVIGIIGNILVLVVVAFSKNMKTHVNLYLSNLCVADILVLIVCMPTVLIELHTKEVWYFGKVMCEFVFFLLNIIKTRIDSTLVSMPRWIIQSAFSSVI